MAADEPENLVFIAWSKDRSQAMALALKEWLRLVVPSSRPWCSKSDIAAGSGWDAELQKSLDESIFGVLCVTIDNYESPWLNYECGHLASKFGRAACPLLLDATTADLQPTPLSRQQAKAVRDKNEMFQVVQGINKALGNRGTPADVLEKLFSDRWGELQEALDRIPTMKADTRDSSDVLREVLQTVTTMNTTLSGMQVFRTPLQMGPPESHGIASGSLRAEPIVPAQLMPMLNPEPDVGLAARTRAEAERRARVAAASMARDQDVLPPLAPTGPAHASAIPSAGGDGMSPQIRPPS